jgi:hypothetical protein
MPKATPEQLREEKERLKAALGVETAGAVVSRHSLPPSLLQALVGLEPEEQERRAAEMAAELAARTGHLSSHPAGSESPSDQGGASPISEAGGEASGAPEEFPDPVKDRPELAAVTKSGPDGGTPPDPGPTNPKDRTSQAIEQTESWSDLEALQASMRRR